MRHHAIAGSFGPDDVRKPRSGAPCAPARRRVSAADQARALPTPSLDWSPRSNVQPRIFMTGQECVSPVEWPFMAPYIMAIKNEESARRGPPGAQLSDAGALSLRPPTSAADLSGSSRIESTKVSPTSSCSAGVHSWRRHRSFLSPHKTVRSGPSRPASRSHRASRLRCAACCPTFLRRARRAYVNTSADVKAEIDICCTSSNALRGGGEPQCADVIFLPDHILAKYVASKPR